MPMAHECPECLSLCYCDCEDHFNDFASFECFHPGSAECLDALSVDADEGGEAGG
jgi:hypothetical protein